MTQELISYQKPGLMERARLALKAFAMKFPSWGGTGWGWWGQGSYTTLDEGQINYDEEIGDRTGSSLVMAAVRWVGNTMPEAPLIVREKKRAEDGGAKLEEVEGHPLAELVKRPNPFYSGSTLWKGFALSWIVDGNAYLLKFRNDMGQVKELWWIPHWMIEPAWPQGGNDFITHYVYTVDGRQYPIPYEDIIHFRDGFDPLNWRKGLSPLRSLLRELYGDIQSIKYAARYAKNFGVPPFILSPKPDQSGVDVDTDKIKAALVRAISGNNTGKPLVLSSAFEVKELAARTAEVSSETTRRIPEERFAAVVGIPAMVLGFGAGLQRSTFSNMEQAHEYAYESYLMPLYRYVEEELNLQLLPEMATGKNQSVGHDISEVRALQEDRSELYKREGLAYMQGIKKRGESRTAIGEKAAPEDNVYFKEPSQNSLPLAQGQPQSAPGDGAEAERRLRLVKAALEGVSANGKG
jgi:HK97 family phage portal protein